MKKGIGLLAASIGLATYASAQFTPGRLVVSVLGNGAAPLSSAAAQVTLQEYQINGTAGFSVLLPTSGSGSNHALTSSGTATSEGALTLSSNASFLTYQGYDATPGTPGVAATLNTGATPTRRVMGRVDLSGSADTTTAIIDAYSGSNIRSSVSFDGSQFWTGGTATTSGGAWNAALGAGTGTQIESAVQNIRNVNIFGGQLYTSSASGAFVGINTIGSGLPTSTGNTLTNVIATGTGSSPYDYVFAGASTCYIADDRATGSGGGLQKWTFNGSTWSLAYTMNVNLTAGLRGLCAATVADGATVLYAITADSTANKLVSITDLGAAAPFTTVATAGTNQIFRGVDFTPVPEPTTLAAVALGIVTLAKRRRK